LSQASSLGGMRFLLAKFDAARIPVMASLRQLLPTE
jgi:hypothetical protein